MLKNIKRFALFCNEILSILLKTFNTVLISLVLQKSLLLPGGGYRISLSVLTNSIKKLHRLSSGAPVIMLHFLIRFYWEIDHVQLWSSHTHNVHILIRFYWEIDQMELWGCELQNASLSCYILSRNWPGGALEPPRS